MSTCIPSMTKTRRLKLTCVNSSFVNRPHSVSSNAASKLKTPRLPLRQFPVILSSSIVCTFCTCRLILGPFGAPQNRACCYTNVDLRVRAAGGGGSSSRASNLDRRLISCQHLIDKNGSITRASEQKPTRIHAPFLTCGRSASRSFMRCRMRCVIPREDSSNTRCLFLLFLGSLLDTSPWPSSSKSSALRFPLRFSRVEASCS
jgi:hypothetical protein